VLRATAALAGDEAPEVVSDAVSSLRRVRAWVYGDRDATRALESFVAAAGRRAYEQLGWHSHDAKPEAATVALRRARIVALMTEVAQDATARTEAKRLALQYLGFGKDGIAHRDVLGPDLAEIAMGVLGEDADAALFDSLVKRMQSEKDSSLRGSLLRAVAHVNAPELAERARDITLANGVGSADLRDLLEEQVWRVESRAGAWSWLQAHADAVVEHLSGPLDAPWSINYAMMLCDEKGQGELEAYLGRLVPKVPGGPHLAAEVRERVAACVAQRGALTPGILAFLRSARRGGRL
jgi:alanyl aminopeptidase